MSKVKISTVLSENRAPPDFQLLFVVIFRSFEEKLWRPNFFKILEDFAQS